MPPGRSPKILTVPEPYASFSASRTCTYRSHSTWPPYNPEKLKVLRGGINPKAARLLAPPSVVKYLEHASSQIARGSESIEELRRGEDFPRPFWDPTLKRDPSLLTDLLQRLHKLGLVSFRPKIQAEKGLFFVHKKGA